MGGDPANGDLIPSGVNAVADLDGRRRETLGRAQGVCSHPLDSGGGIGENGEAAPCSLLLALNPK